MEPVSSEQKTPLTAYCFLLTELCDRSRITNKE